MNKIDLNGEWVFAVAEVEHPGTTLADLERGGLKLLACSVPGCLENDLQASGILPPADLFAGKNILQAQRLERHHVWYGRRFSAEVPSGTVPQLVFEGVDCFADVYLNGGLVGSIDNMLIPHSFSLEGLLRNENEILVHIRPVVLEARKYPYPAGLAAQGTAYESLYVRKAPHMFGWDIMPRAVSAGIWRPVRLEFSTLDRLEEVYLETVHLAPDHSRAELRFHFHAIIADGDYEIAVSGECASSRFSISKRLAFDAGQFTFSVDSPRLWWPRGAGTSDLYEITVQLLRNGMEIDRVQFRHGIRSIALERSSVTDEAGTGSFRFLVNGEPVFIKGTNWVPADAFHWRDAERIPRILPLVLESGCNLLRCWGGNVYENDAFFDWCDTHGILVWQDFAMACAVYPQDAGFQQRLKDEVACVIKRLRQHACVALWAGDNECDQFHGCHHRGDPNRNVLTRVVIPEVLKLEDPGRPYLPSSPFIDPVAFEKGEHYLPENHLWGPRDYYKGSYYTGAACHFASEIGYHGAPHVSSLVRFLSPEKLWPPQDNDEWMLHSTNPMLDTALFSPPEHRVNLMINQIRVLFGKVPDALPDFVFASQASQAEALKFFIEQFRAGKENWRRTGIIWWNLMDGWPQLSDAVVDYYFTKKLAFDFIARSQKDVCVLLREPREGRQDIVVVNDAMTHVGLSYTIRNSDGELIASGSEAVPPNKARTIGSIASDPAAHEFYLMEWESDSGKGKNHYLSGNAPFDLELYREWLRRNGLLPEVFRK